MNATVVKKEARYVSAIGRRKTAVANARLTPDAKTSFLINNKELAIYFPTASMQDIASSPLTKANPELKFRVTARINGGGIEAQAVALRHAISRALILHNHELRKKLKKLGFLKRDPRMKERRKFGLKKARKAPQWSKR